MKNPNATRDLSALDAELRDVVKGMTDDELLTFTAKLGRWHEQMDELVIAVFSSRPRQLFSKLQTQGT